VELGVSQMTVNKSILEMVERGWLYREHGRGTFVSDEFEPPLPSSLHIGVVSQVEAGRIMEDYYLGTLFRGMQSAMADAPVSLSIMGSGGSLYDRLSSAGMDGYLVVDLPRDSVGAAHRLAADGKRLVVLSTSWPELRVPQVDSDNRTGARAAMEHLLDLGHRRIAAVFTLLPTSNSLDRLGAYDAALRARSIELPSDYCVMAEDAFASAESRAERVRALLVRSDAPTAFFCAGYYSALETLQVIREAELRVPDDVSLVAFDDPISAAHISPPLTTVRQPLEAMGRLAMSELLQWLTRREQPELRQVLPTHLIVRGSTGPAPVGAVAPAQLAFEAQPG
jgi:DNA-binding LacI/PurR family transcriptional regulator